MRIRDWSSEVCSSDLLDFLGASDDRGPGGAACFLPGAVPLSRIEGKPVAFLVRANVLAEWRPARLFTLSAAPRAQWAASRSPTSPTSRRFRITAAGRLSAAACKERKDRKSTRLNSSH